MSFKMSLFMRAHNRRLYHNRHVFLGLPQCVHERLLAVSASCHRKCEVVSKAPELSTSLMLNATSPIDDFLNDVTKRHSACGVAKMSPGPSLVGPPKRKLLSRSSMFNYHRRQAGLPTGRELRDGSLTELIARCLHTTWLAMAEQSPGSRTKIEQTLDLLKQEIARDSALTKRQDAADEVANVKKTLWQRTKDECKHYWHGLRLFSTEFRISLRLGWRLLRGSTLTRRERKQLVRTVSDVFRMFPFLVILAIPFMELAIPVLIKLFPGFLPSTFQERSKEDEKIRNQLNIRLEMAKFLQQTMEEMSLERKKSKAAGDVSSAVQFADFMKRIREQGSVVSNEELLKFSKFFVDELTLDNLSIPQLRACCRIVGISVIGPPNLLRLRLNLKLRELKADDRLIVKEGIDHLTPAELQSANRARGMRALGMTEERLKSQLSQWLELSLNDKVPPSLLLLSRSLYLPEDIPFNKRLSIIMTELPETIATETSLKLADLEGDKIDNKAKLQLILSIEDALKRERKEELDRRQKAKLAKAEQEKAELAAKQEDIVKETEEAVQAAKVLASAQLAVSKLGKDLSVKEAMDAKALSDAGVGKEDIQQIGKALKAVVGVQEDKEVLEELKEDFKEYSEDLSQVQALTVLKGESVRESKGATRLRKKVNSLINQMDGLVNQLQKGNGEAKISNVVQLGAIETSELPDAVAAHVDARDLVAINELMSALRGISKLSDETKESRIEQVLEALDDDHDGSIDVDMAFEVIEILGRENVKLGASEMQNIRDMLKKEGVANLDSDPSDDPVAKSKSPSKSSNSKKSESSLNKDGGNRSGGKNAEMASRDVSEIADRDSSNRASSSSSTNSGSTVNTLKVVGDKSVGPGSEPSARTISSTISQKIIKDNLENGSSTPASLIKDLSIAEQTGGSGIIGDGGSKDIAKTLNAKSTNGDDIAKKL